MSIELWILGIPPGGNALHRMTHWEVRRSREEWRRTSWLVARAAGDRERMSRVRIDATWRFRVQRDRDLDNLIAGLKPILDGLVDAGMITGDSSEVVQEITGRVEVVGSKGQDGILLRIEEVQG